MTYGERQLEAQVTAKLMCNSVALERPEQARARFWTWYHQVQAAEKIRCGR